MHDELETLAPLYALGALDGDDLSRFVAHLAQCAECRNVVREHEEAAQALAFALPPVAPRPSLRQEIAAKVVRRNKPWAPLAAAAAFVIASLAAVIVLRRSDSYAEKVVRLLKDPETKVVQLVGTKDAPNARGRVLWNGKEAVFVGTGLPDLPGGKVYELWAIVATVPKAAGTYTVDSRGRWKEKDVLPVPAADAFAITIESGLREAPTPPIYLLPN